MAKKFTKFTIGDVVKTVGSKVFKKLTTILPVVEDELQGTWVLPVEVGLDFSYYNNLYSDQLSWEVTYNCGIVWNSNSDAEYSVFRIRRIKGSSNVQYNELSFDYFKVYQKYINVERDDVYNFGGVFTITSKLSEVENGAELLAWLKANATKQSASTPTLISFTIGGTKYQAAEGMEWASWVGSAYNTHGYFMEGIAIYDSDYTRIYYQPYTSANITIYGSDIILANGTYGTFQSMSGGSN